MKSGGIRKIQHLPDGTFCQTYYTSYNLAQRPLQAWHGRGRLALMMGWVSGLRELDERAQSRECHFSGVAPALVLPLASVVGGMAWGVARSVSSVLEGYLED
jgi:hypothetical protein